MDSLPEEILEIIYSHLSQKYLVRCSLVCRNWFLATRLPKYYFTIKITNYKQLVHFIDMATTSTINNISIGLFVRNLYLEDLFKIQSTIPMTKVQDLYNACPNIEYIDTLHTYRVAEARNEFPYWKKLTHIHPWVTIHNKKRFFELVQQQQHQQEQNELILPITCLDFFEYDYKNKLTKMKHEKQFSFYNSSIMYTSNLPETFFLSFSFTWYHLTSLSISFEYSFFNNEPYKLNDHTFESFHQSCPSLESLTIKELELSISDDYLKYTQLTETATSSSVCHGIKQKKLTSLHLINCIIIQSTIFEYFLKKYPHLSTLELRLEINEEEDNHFSTYMYHLISGLQQLKHLFVTFENIPSLSLMANDYDHFQPNDHLFHHDQFKQWLSNHHQLESLEYPYALNWPSSSPSSLSQLYASTPIINNTNVVQQDKNQLTLLDDLFYINGNPIQATFFLTSLSLHGFKPFNNSYSITNYLNTFPNLKTLEITYAGLNDYEMEMNEHAEIVAPSTTTRYPLEKLVLKDVHLCFNCNVTHFFKQFPHLKILNWTKVTIFTYYNQFTAIFTDDGTQRKEYIDLKHLDLDEIRMKKVEINRYSKIFDSGIRDKIIINEVRDDEIKDTVCTSPSSTETEFSRSKRYILQIDCRSVNLVQLS